VEDRHGEIAQRPDQATVIAVERIVVVKGGGVVDLAVLLDLLEIDALGLLADDAERVKQAVDAGGGLAGGIEFRQIDGAGHQSFPEVLVGAKFCIGRIASARHCSKPAEERTQRSRLRIESHEEGARDQFVDELLRERHWHVRGRRSGGDQRRQSLRLALVLDLYGLAQLEDISQVSQIVDGADAALKVGDGVLHFLEEFRRRARLLLKSESIAGGRRLPVGVAKLVRDQRAAADARRVELVAIENDIPTISVGSGPHRLGRGGGGLAGVGANASVRERFALRAKQALDRLRSRAAISRFEIRWSDGVVGRA
jgi:hypothetical protein